jgi:hypothetical protein
MSTKTVVSSVVYSGGSWKYFADGWKAYTQAGGSGSGTFSQNTITIENGVVQKCLNWNQGTAASGSVYLRQYISGHHYRGKTITVSVYFRDVNNDGGFYLQVGDGVSAETLTLSTTGRYTLQFTCDDAYVDDALYIGIVCASSSTFILRLADVSLYESDTPAPVRTRSYDEELTLCQYRCWKSNPDWNPLVTSTQGRPCYALNMRTSTGAYSNRWFANIQTPVTMRRIPDRSIYPGRASVGVLGQATHYTANTLVDFTGFPSTSTGGLMGYFISTVTGTIQLISFMLLLEADI